MKICPFEANAFVHRDLNWKDSASLTVDRIFVMPFPRGPLFNGPHHHLYVASRTRHTEKEEGENNKKKLVFTRSTRTS